MIIFLFLVELVAAPILSYPAWRAELSLSIELCTWTTLFSSDCDCWLFWKNIFIFAQKKFGFSKMNLAFWEKIVSLLANKNKRNFHFWYISSSAQWINHYCNSDINSKLPERRKHQTLVMHCEVSQKFNYLFIRNLLEHSRFSFIQSENEK